MEAPTCEQLSEYDGKEFKVVSEDHDTSWRHGTLETSVFHRLADDTYWEAKYRLSTDGETNELTEGVAAIKRVYPHQVTVTKYSPVPE